MKKTLYISVIALLTISFNSCSKNDNEGIMDDTPIQFNDPNFLKALLRVVNEEGMEPMDVDTNRDGQISRKEAAQVKALYIGTSHIRQMDEIKYFTALEYLDCGGNYIASLDVSNNRALKVLSAEYCDSLTSLNVRNCKVLKKLRCDNFDYDTDPPYFKQLTSLDISDCVALEELECQNNKLTSLDLSKNTALVGLWCWGNPLTSLDLSKNSALKELGCCGKDNITELDLSKNKKLEFLSVSSDNNLLSIYLYKYNTIAQQDMDRLQNNCPNATIYYVE